MPKKYTKGTLASEEHRYADASTCLADATSFYNGDYPNGGGNLKPPQIEMPDPNDPKLTTIYSWRKPNTDVEMRFIVVTDPNTYSETICYHRVIKSSKGPYKGDKDDLNEAIGTNELGAGSYIYQDAIQDIKPVAPGKYLVWRAIVRQGNGSSFLPGDPPTGFTTNPPYPP